MQKFLITAALAVHGQSLTQAASFQQSTKHQPGDQQGARSVGSQTSSPQIGSGSPPVVVPVPLLVLGLPEVSSPVLVSPLSGPVLEPAEPPVEPASLLVPELASPPVVVSSGRSGSGSWSGR